MNELQIAKLVGITHKRYFKELSRLEYWRQSHECREDVLQDVIAHAVTNNVSFNEARYEIVKLRQKLRRACPESFIHKQFWGYGQHKMANFNFDACAFFDKLNMMLEAHGYPPGLHATNGYEKAIYRNKYTKDRRGYVMQRCYYADFYIPKHNVVVEYNEPHHYESLQMRRQDLYRRRFIESYFDLPVVVAVEKTCTLRDVFNQVCSAIELSIEKENYR